MTHARRTAQLILAIAVLPVSCRMPAIDTFPPGPVLLTLVTWNTDSGRGDLLGLVADLESGSLSGRPSTGYLLFLQEAAETELDAIAGPRGWTTAFVPARGGDGRTRGNAIVFSGALRSPRAVPLPRERQPRVAALASIDLAGHELFVGSVHLENRVSWWKGGLLSDTARKHQVEGLLHAIPPDAPGILGGDFNTWLGPNEPGWRSLVERFHDPRDWPRQPTFGNRLVLDHLLMDLPDGWRMTRRVVANDYGADHRPVMGMVLGL